MIRKAFLMSVNPDKHKEYERRHNPIWKELQDIFRKHGVLDYSIFLDPETSQLFGYVVIEDEQRWDAISRTDACRRWWAFMKDVMPTNPDNSPVSRDLREVFHFRP